MKLNFHGIVSGKYHALGISNFSSFFCLRGFHFDMASKKTNSARATGLIRRVYNVTREEKKDGKLSYL